MTITTETWTTRNREDHACARRLRVEIKVRFIGRLRWDEMPDLYQRADAFLFTSLRDSFGTQVLEAMGQGLPILTLDHQGVGTFVPPDAAIKVPVTNPRETVRGIAEGIRWLGRNPEARPRMGEAGHAYAKTQTWEKRAETMSKLYEEVLAHPGCQQAEALCGSKGTAHDPSTSGLNSFPRYYP